MNRIFGFNGRNKSRHQRCSRSERPIDAPHRCGFCGCSLKGCMFVAWTMASVTPPAAICRTCVENFSVQALLSRNAAIWHTENPNYAPLSMALRKRLSGENGSSALKQAIIRIGIRLLMRSSAILGGASERCPKTGVALELPRIAIIGSEINLVGPLLWIVCKEIGLIYMRCLAVELNFGDAYRRLVKSSCNGEKCWAEHAVIYCSNGYVESPARAAIIYTCREQSEIPSDIERVCIES